MAPAIVRLVFAGILLGWTVHANENSVLPSPVCSREEEDSSATLMQKNIVTRGNLEASDSEDQQQHQVLAEACAAVRADDVCACIAAGCVAQELSPGRTVCLHRLPADGRAVACQPTTPFPALLTSDQSAAIAVVDSQTSLASWAGKLNEVVKDPNIGLAVGASASILGGILGGEQLTGSDVLTIAANWIPTVVGMTNPILGLALTFAFSLIQGLMGTTQEDPLQEMYRRIMREVDMKIDHAFMRFIFHTTSVGLELILTELSRLPGYNEGGLHSEDEQYKFYFDLKNDLEGKIIILVRGESVFTTDFEKQRYRASALPIVITCFDTYFNVVSEIIQLRPNHRELLKSEISQRLTDVEPFFEKALVDAWLVRRRYIYALQWVGQIVRSVRKACSHALCDMITTCSTKGSPACTEGFTGVNACTEMGCTKSSGSWTIRGVASCTAGKNYCDLGHHSRLLTSAEQTVRHQHESVEAIRNILNDDYSFRDSVCSQMQFSLDEAGFAKAVGGFTKRVMNCYIRRAGATLRSDLGTLDKWVPADLRRLSQKYVGSSHTLSDLRSDINQIRSSSGNAPAYQMPDPKTCGPVSERLYSKSGRITREKKGTSYDGCKQHCKNTPGCHCVEYYGDARSCVLVSKGTTRSKVNMFWWDKPSATRLDQCGETGEIC